MKIAVFGAGAIGGYLAVKLHQAGAEVSVIARGPHLAAMRENGLTLKSEGQTVTVQSALHRQAGRSRAAGLCHRHPEGQRACAGRGARDRQADGPRTPRW